MIHAMFTISMVAPPSSEQRMNAFAKVYSEGRWLNGADGALCLSGWSAVKAGQGKKALAAVVHVMTKYELNAVLDIPVGDGCFAEALIKQIREERNVSYHGVDIVPELITSITKRLGDAMTTFEQADVVALDELPRSSTSSLLFSRMMTQHMCNEDALKFLKLLSSSNNSFAMLTTFRTETTFSNYDIRCASSGYRPQDLTKPPFGLPPPLYWFDEDYPVDNRVGLGLWKLPFQTHLEQNRTGQVSQGN